MTTNDIHTAAADDNNNTIKPLHLTLEDTSMNNTTSDRMEEGPSPVTTTIMDTADLAAVGDNAEVDMMEGKDEEGQRKKLVKAGLLFMLVAVVTYVVLDYTVS